MQEILDRIATQIGVDQAVADKAVAMIVSFIFDHISPDIVAKIKEAVPGIEELATVGTSYGEAAQAADAGASGGGLMGALGGLMGGGGIAGALGGLMGGQGGIGGALALLGQLNKEGLDLSQVQQLATSLVGELRQVAGDENVDKLVAQIPGAGQLLG